MRSRKHYLIFGRRRKFNMRTTRKPAVAPRTRANTTERQGRVNVDRIYYTYYMGRARKSKHINVKTVLAWFAAAGPHEQRRFAAETAGHNHANPSRGIYYNMLYYAVYTRVCLSWRRRRRGRLRVYVSIIAPFECVPLTSRMSGYCKRGRTDGGTLEMYIANTICVCRRSLWVRLRARDFFLIISTLHFAV